MNTHPSFSGAEEEFEAAWRNPRYTPIELEAVDVNALLEESYSASEPVRLTRAMLWDAEVKKFWFPWIYIAGVVREGTSYGRKLLGNGDESFLRPNQQRAWKTGVHGQVLEEIYLSPQKEKVVALGRAEFLSEDGSPLRAGGHQPLFHVEHSVGGSDLRPLNQWRIVHLTEERDDALIQRQLAMMGNSQWLREFLEIYVQRDLRIQLTPRN